MSLRPSKRIVKFRRAPLEEFRDEYSCEWLCGKGRNAGCRKVDMRSRSGHDVFQLNEPGDLRKGNRKREGGPTVNDDGMEGD